MKQFALIVLVIVNACARMAVDPAPFVVESPSPAVAGANTLQENVSIETLGGVLTPLLKQGCTIPCRQSFVFSTAADGESEIKIRLFRGSTTIATAHPLGLFHVTGFTPMPRGQPKVRVSLIGSAEGIELVAVDLRNGAALNITRKDEER
jgi:molecular chaperone DnaK (HSP70)